MPRTGFDPRAHGFHFANDFVDKIVTVPGYGEVATDGRSGGMAFAGKRFELDQRFDLVLNPSSVLTVEATGVDGGGAKAGLVREPYLGLDGWGAGDHAYRARPAPGDGRRPGPEAGDGPWTVEFAVEVTPLDA